MLETRGLRGPMKSIPPASEHPSLRCIVFVVCEQGKLSQALTLRWHD